MVEYTGENGMREQGVLGKTLEMISEAVFPSNIYCACCGSLIDGTRPYALCDSCMEKIHWNNGRTCGKCGKALPETYRGAYCYDCMEHPRGFRRGYSCLTYGLYERELILDYKYNGKGYLGKKFGDILFDRIRWENPEIDVIIPVPIHNNRMKKRGYNQTELMAARLAQRWGKTLAADSLQRVKETTLLRSLSPVERESALRGAFAVTKKGESEIKGKAVLLVDYIYTTGATIEECCRVLLEGGASAVDFLTLASGGNRSPRGL